MIHTWYHYRAWSGTMLCHGKDLIIIVLDFSEKKLNIFAFFITSWHSDGTGSWNLSSWKTRICLSSIVNTMTADGLATQGRRVSAAMVLIQLSQNIPESAPQMSQLTHWGWDKVATFSHMTFSSAFSWMKMYEIWLRFPVHTCSSFSCYKTVLSQLTLIIVSPNITMLTLKWLSNLVSKCDFIFWCCSPMCNIFIWSWSNSI